MTKKVSEKREYSKLVLGLAFCSFLLLLIGSVCAADVGYIYKSKPMIDKNVISVFTEMNLSVDLIPEKNLTKYDLSKYRFIYVGNERFTKTIPVNSYPSVVDNYYFGYKWGLTDNDGVSKLASTSPLSVFKDGQVIQVYTQAKYPNGAISLPYFYLGNLDKVPAMQQVAGTFIGNAPNFDLGDVISFAPAGTHLINGKNTVGPICFYGIVESKYWTTEARDMFKQCVGMVLVQCSQDADCGTDSTGDKYCSLNGVYQNTTHYSCLNPGTSQSQCATNVITNKVEDCSPNKICQNGVCININCTQNSDCGIDGFQDNFFCQNNSVFGNYITYTCNNPGTPQSSCSNLISIQLKQTCPSDETCSNGICTGNIICYNNSMCGNNGYVGDKFCQGNSVFQNYATYTCNNPGTKQSSCSNITLPQPIIDCNEFTETCQNGNCIEITQDNHDVALTNLPNSVGNIKIEYPNGTDILDNPAVLNCNQIYKIYVNLTNKGVFYENVSLNGSIDGQTFVYAPVMNFAPGISYIKYQTVNVIGSGTYNLIVNAIIPFDINPFDNIASRQVIVNCPICTQDSNCGSDSYGDNYCMNNNVYHDLHHPICLNGECSESVTPVLVQQCSQGCSNGQCNNTCNILCASNSDCGTNVFTGNPVCQNGNVYQNYLTYTCVNANQCSSSCSTSTNLILKQTCLPGQTCSNGACVPINVTCSTDAQCNDNNIYTYDQCNNPGTPSSYCSHTPINCATNNDCGITGFIGDEFCSQNDVFKNFMNSTCINPETPLSYCQITLGPKLVTDCGQGICQNATCIIPNITCSLNSQCGTNGFTGNPFCQGSSVFQNFITYTCNNPGTPTSSCTSSTNPQLILNCPQGQTCSNGQCIPVNIPCTFNSDCGTNMFVNGLFCMNGDVFQNYLSFTCHNPGAQNSFCTNSTSPQIKDDCDNQTEVCSNGQCIPVNIPCSTNSQCGTNGFTGNPFCQGNSVFQNFITYTCNNPGQTNSYCSSSTAPQLTQTCPQNQVCSNGVCAPVTCSNDAQCDDSNSHTQDTCNNPGTPQSYCTHTPIACLNNGECGANGPLGNPFCQGNNVFQNFLTYTCNNPGQTNSYCSSSTAPQLTQTCLQNQVCNNGQCNNQTIICSTNSQCDDSNAHTQDICNNPGTPQSFCSHNPILCLNNGECGANGPLGNPFCQGNSIFQNFITYTCNNPGTPQSTCSVAVSPQLNQNCLANQVCNNGQCNNQTIVCSTNSQCGTNGFTGSPFCQGSSVFQNFITYTCNNPGTPSSSCTSSTNPQLTQTCPQNQVCNNGQCNNQTIVCSTNSQCGTNGPFGSPFCQGNSVFQNFLTYTCNNPGTANSFCSNSVSSQLTQSCLANQVCNSGQCNNQTIPCSTNSQCGTNGFTGSPFCQGNNVFQNFLTYTCNNPGQTNSYCSSSTAPQLTQTCPQNQVCSNGVCAPVICSNDGQCDDSNTHTQDKCNNPGTPQSYCSHTPIACLNNGECGTNGFTGNPFCTGNNVFQNFITYTCNNPGTPSSSCTSSTNPQLTQTCPQNQVCNNGACVPLNIPCTFNSDCGTNGFTGNPFCQGSSVFQNFITYTCNNPGQTNSYCSSSTAPQLTQTCPQGQTCSGGTCVPVTCSNDAQCDDSNTHTQDKCNNPGTPQSYCSHTPIACLNNGECGTNGPFGSPFCQGNSVFQNFLTYTCNNPGTIQSSCSSSSAPQLNQTCPQNQVCSNGACVSVTCFNDTQCDDSNTHTQDKCNNPGTPSSYCTHNPITCLNNSDCGTNGFTGNPFCTGNNVFQNFLTYTCNNPGTIQSSCSISSAPQLNQTCPQNQVCSNGACVPVTCFNDTQCDDSNSHTQDTCNNPGTPQSYCSHTPITCLNNSDCGTNVFTGNPFCTGNNVFQNFLTYTCNNPGTPSSSCTNSTNPQLKQTCPSGQTCSNGACVANTCGGTLTSPSVSVSGIKFTALSQTVDSNATNTLFVSVQNLDSFSKTITYNKVTCRCQLHTGDPSLQGCYSFWPGSTSCIITPETTTLNPNEVRTINIAATQYQNMVCGSFQLDLFLTSVNGSPLNTLSAYSFADLCTSC